MLYKKKTNDIKEENMKIVDNILNEVRERVLKLNKSIQPAKPKGVDNELLDVLKDATAIPAMADSLDKDELEKSIDKEIGVLEEKQDKLNKTLEQLKNKIKTKSGLSEFWK